MAAVLLALVLITALPAAAAALLGRELCRIADIHSLRGLAHLALLGLPPHAPRDPYATQRAIANHLRSRYCVTASGRRSPFGSLDLHLSSEAFQSISTWIGIEAARADLESFYRSHALCEGWTLPDQTRIGLTRDISLRPRQIYSRPQPTAHSPQPTAHSPQPTPATEGTAPASLHQFEAEGRGQQPGGTLPLLCSWTIRM